MKPGFAPVAAALAVLAGAAAASDGPPAPLAVGVLERDLPQLIASFEGDWDNAEQVGFADELGFPDGASPVRRHITIRRIEAPGIGPPSCAVTNIGTTTRPGSVANACMPSSSIR